jgi:hypothetical protein
MDEDLHENPREFIPDRYMNKKKFMKNGKQVVNHSMPWGFGVSKCEGRQACAGHDS